MRCLLKIDIDRNWLWTIDVGKWKWIYNLLKWSETMWENIVWSILFCWLRTRLLRAITIKNTQIWINYETHWSVRFRPQSNFSKKMLTPKCIELIAFDKEFKREQRNGNDTRWFQWTIAECPYQVWILIWSRMNDAICIINSLCNTMIYLAFIVWKILCVKYYNAFTFVSTDNGIKNNKFYFICDRRYTHATFQQMYKYNECWSTIGTWNSSTHIVALISIAWLKIL